MKFILTISAWFLCACSFAQKNSGQVKLSCGASRFPTGRLYVVDEKISDSLTASKISSTQIESTTVLKDAEAMALYGSQGFHGVILIKTKPAEIKIVIDSSGTRPRYLFRYGNLSDTSLHPFLIVLNGVPFEQGELPWIAPENIQSIHILRDTLNSVIGCSSRRGVILITTKCQYTEELPVF
jgi:TonB-dependent SusC/RagA subfamily outer membrane receptor